MTPGLRDIFRKVLRSQKLEGAFSAEVVAGGSINHCYRIRSGARSFFVKLNSASKFPQLFEKESAALRQINHTRAFRVPEQLQLLHEGDWQGIVLEWVEPAAIGPSFWRRFGEQLAQLHHNSAAQFGFDESNYMGSVPQQNSWTDSWVEFFRTRRLEPMVRCCENLLTIHDHEKFQHLYKNLESHFERNDRPSLLHGDLWNGNFICAANSEVVLIDPAVYYGHPAVDIGLTKLFGGFEKSFYQSYLQHASLSSNWEEQASICNLYPLLIHLYLFGPSYLPQIRSTLQHLA